MLLLIYYLSPSISVGTVDNGVFDKDQNTSNFQKSNEMYFVTISEKNLENYSTEKIRLVDEQNKEVEIERKEISSQGKPSYGFTENLMPTISWFITFKRKMIQIKLFFKRLFPLLINHSI